MTSIAQERAALARVGRPLRSREQAGFRFGNYDVPRGVSEPATRVFVHITITNPGSYSSDDAHARAVESIGINRFPSTGLSYNRLIMQSGRVYEGQPIGRRGAHTLNDERRSTCSTSGCVSKGGPLTAPSWNLNVNARSYAICQNVQHEVTDAQLDSLARTIAADMLAGFVRKDAKIHGHRCVSSKSCPGDKMWARMGELNTLVRRYVANGFKPAASTPVDGRDVTIAAAAIWHAVAQKSFNPTDRYLVDVQQFMAWAAHPNVGAIDQAYFDRWLHCKRVSDWRQLGAVTEQTLLAVQRKFGLPDDGVFGPKTAAKLRTYGYTVTGV